MMDSIVARWPARGLGLTLGCQTVLPRAVVTKPKPKTAKKISRVARENCSIETLKGLQVSVADLTARERPEDPREAFATARQWAQSNYFIGGLHHLTNLFFNYGLKLTAADPAQRGAFAARAASAPPPAAPAGKAEPENPAAVSARAPARKTFRHRGSQPRGLGDLLSSDKPISNAGLGFHPIAPARQTGYSRRMKVIPDGRDKVPFDPANDLRSPLIGGRSRKGRPPQCRWHNQKWTGRPIEVGIEWLWL